MPAHAIAAAPSAKVTALADIPALLDRMVREPVPSVVVT
jgi:hypothetical protein